MRRLALLVTGLIEAKTGVLAHAAAALDALGLTGTKRPESIERRRGRTVSDRGLDQATCSAPAVAALLAAAALIVPAGLAVVVADRADDVPAVVDRVAAVGWQGVVRGHRRRGGRWKARGWGVKAAGWREGSVVARWSGAETEAVATHSDLPWRWRLLQRSARRFWTEPGVRNR